MATIQLGPFPYQQKFDLCELLSEVNTTCPVQKGPLNVTVKTKIPDGTPPVSWKVDNAMPIIEAHMETVVN